MASLSSSVPQFPGLVHNLNKRLEEVYHHADKITKRAVDRVFLRNIWCTQKPSYKFEK